MFIGTALDHSVPLVLAALGCLIAVRAGVVNIGIEGSLLSGAFAGAAVSSLTGSPWAGLLAAVLAGTAPAAVLGLAKLRWGADEILAGFALNTIAAGATVTGLFALTRDGRTLQVFALPGLDLPLLGDVSPLTLLTVLLAPVLVLWYFNTRSGVWVRAVGSNTGAVVEAGISPVRVQWAAVLTSGAFAGLAGAQLSLFTTNTFVRDMSQGRGFIALGAVYLGAKHPVGTIVAACAFGTFEATTTVLQTRTSFPTDALLALPYIATVAALAVAGARSLAARRPLQTA